MAVLVVIVVRREDHPWGRPHGHQIIGCRRCLSGDLLDELLERGDRALTVPRLAELADFYGMPVSELLPESREHSRAVTTPTTKIILNLERLLELPTEAVGPLARYAATIQSQRREYNGKVLAIRTEDLRLLAIPYERTPSELTDQLIAWGVLTPESGTATGVSTGPALTSTRGDTPCE